MQIGVCLSGIIIFLYFSTIYIKASTTRTTGIARHEYIVICKLLGFVQLAVSSVQHCNVSCVLWLCVGVFFFLPILNISTWYVIGGFFQEQLRVTVWEPTLGTVLAGEDAPFAKDVDVWLEAHPG